MVEMWQDTKIKHKNTRNVEEFHWISKTSSVMIDFTSVNKVSNPKLSKLTGTRQASIPIHPSILLTTCSCKDHGGAGAYPSSHQVKGRVPLDRSQVHRRAGT